MDLLNQPEFKQTATQVTKHTANNAVKLGAVAATAIFVNNVFKAMAKHTIDTVQQDYYLIRNIMKNGLIESAIHSGSIISSLYYFDKRSVKLYFILISGR